MVVEPSSIWYAARDLASGRAASRSDLTDPYDAARIQLRMSVRIARIFSSLIGSTIFKEVGRNRDGEFRFPSIARKEAALL